MNRLSWRRRQKSSLQDERIWTFCWRNSMPGRRTTSPLVRYSNALTRKGFRVSKASTGSSTSRTHPIRGGAEDSHDCGKTRAEECRSSGGQRRNQIGRFGIKFAASEVFPGKHPPSTSGSRPSLNLPPPAGNKAGGILTAIECPGEGVIFVLKSNGKILRFYVPDPMEIAHL